MGIITTGRHRLVSAGIGGRWTSAGTSSAAWKPWGSPQTSGADCCSAIVMVQNFFVGPALIGHDCRTNLAQPDAMSPSGAAQDEAPRFLIDDERRTVKMRTR